MYGKTLDDFPARADVFMAALADLSEADIQSGFERAVTVLREFPVPVEIRELSIEARREAQRRAQDERFRNQRQIEDRSKAERFEESDHAIRKREFEQMLAESARRTAMP